MKSNQERSNECLPPKKREIPASTLASEERSAAPGPATDSQRTENLAWLASVASGHRNASDVDGPQYKPSATEPAPPPSCTSSSSSSASSDLRLVSSLPTVYTSPLSQPTVGGAIHYTQLPPSLQFIASPYPSSYTGYISSQLLPPPPPPPPLSSSSSHSSPSSASLAPHRPSHAETAFTSPSTCSSSSSALCPPSSHSQASKYDQQRMSAARASMPPPSTDATPHYVHLSAAPRTAASAHHHHHHHHHHQGGAHLPTLPLHPHHSMAHGTSQVLVQYADGPNRKEEGGTRPREPHNGELERGRRYGVSPDSGFSKPGSKLRDVPPPPPPPSTYEGRQLVLPADYASHDPSGLRASLMLMPNSHRDHQQLQPQASPDKRPGSAPGHPDKGGMALGKPVNRTASSSSPTFAFPSPLSVDSLKASASGSSSPHTVIQTTQNATEPMSLGLSSTSIFPQPPIIGYIAGSGSQQQPISYHAGLSQHLLIPGTQPVIIPVSSGGAGVTPTDATTPHLVSSTQAPPFPGPLPHTYIAAAATTKGEVLDTPCATYHQVASGTAVQAQLHLPVVAPPPSSTSLPPSLPPYFIKGSIIQLADGELKRVEDLKTEDFIQSAEISSELKIDSSTVERIDGSHASPNIAVVQFSVGEHRSQVSVEVLVEYPFFVFGQGWSSCCPDRTTQLLELPCSKLSVGDVCISLTLKNLRNGALKKAQSLEFAIPSSNASHGHPTPLRGPAAEAPRCSGPSSRHGERENGVNSRGAGGTENGDLRFVERGSVSKDQAAAGADATPGKTSTSRKRRWSAPEGRKVERTEEEPPMALPKPSFIPHEVKVSIEGRSNVGK